MRRCWRSSVLPTTRGRLVLALRRVAHEQFDERPLLLDHDDLLETVRELPHDAGVERIGHSEAHHTNARIAQRLVVEAEIGERLAIRSRWSPRPPARAT